jgi:hypothetical protein
VLLEGRDAAKHSAGHRMTSPPRPQQRILWLKISIVLRLRNSDLYPAQQIHILSVAGLLWDQFSGNSLFSKGRSRL